MERLKEEQVPTGENAEWATDNVLLVKEVAQMDAYIGFSLSFMFHPLLTRTLSLTGQVYSDGGQ